MFPGFMIILHQATETTGVATATTSAFAFASASSFTIEFIVLFLEKPCTDLVVFLVTDPKALH